MPRTIKGDVLYPFATLSLVAVVLIGVTLGMILGRDIEERMQDSVTGTTASAVTAAVQPLVQGLDLSAPLSDSAYGQLNDSATRSVLSQETLRVRIYSPAGVAVYSSEAGEVGRVQADESALNNALQEVTTSKAGGSELRPDGAGTVGEVLDVYTPLYAADTHRPAAVLEIHQDYTKTAASIAGAQKTLYLNVGVALLGLYAVLQFGAWGATRTLARDHARLNYLYQTGEHVRASLDTQDVLTQIARDATVLANGQYSLVCLVEQETGDLVARASYDQTKNTVSLHHAKMDEWLFHRVVGTGKTNSSVQQRVRFALVFGPELENASVSVLCVPMKLRNKVNGLIVVLRRSTSDGFGRAETQMLEELAGQASMAVEQAGLFAKVRAYASELELSYDTTLKALIAALDAKDAVTEGHSERVSALTVAIARAMQVPDNRLVDIERGALLHDVGKIGVPDEVLRKPRTLSKREWQAMQRHPLLAGLLVSKVGFLEGALPILMYHHERYDGRGYPFGLAGDRIPLEARIFAVVDAYDAMTSDRPYREAMPHDEAMREIVANANSQFDPMVVEVFQRVIEEAPIAGCTPSEEAKQVADFVAEKEEDAA